MISIVTYTSLPNLFYFADALTVLVIHMQSESELRGMHGSNAQLARMHGNRNDDSSTPHPHASTLADKRHHYVIEAARADATIH